MSCAVLGLGRLRLLNRGPAASGGHQPGRRRTAAAVAGAGRDRRYPTRQARAAGHLPVAAQLAQPQAAQAGGRGSGQQDGPHCVGHDDEREDLPASAGGLTVRLPREQGSREKMLIGRSEDPHNPCRVAASRVSYPFGSGSRNPSGPAAAGRDTQAGHTTATAPHRKFFFPTPLHQGGRPHTPYAC